LADTPRIERVDDAERRRRFNAAYLAGTLSGQYTLKHFGRQSLYQNPPIESGLPQEPEGTITGLIAIIDPQTNQRLAVAHRLLRPDGTFGASGYPDPKMVFVDGVIYLQKRKEGRAPRDVGLPSLFTDSPATG
jgi:hypothetical protein